MDQWGATCFILGRHVIGVWNRNMGNISFMITFFGVTFLLFAASDLLLLTVALRLGRLLAGRHVTDLVNRTKHKTQHWILSLGSAAMWRPQCGLTPPSPSYQWTPCVDV